MKIKLLIGVTLMSVALVGCGQTSPKEEVSQKIEIEAQNIALNLSKAPETLDPQLNSEGEGSLIIHNVYEGLMRQVGEELINGMAESYTVSEDGLVYTFTLRQASWSDGAEVTAMDFEYAWRRGADPITGSSHLKDYENAKIKNAGAIARGEMSTATLGVLALDANVLEVTLEEPNDAFLDYMTLESFIPVREEVVDASGEWSKTNAVCNGPFKVASFNDGGIRLEKNESYWDAQHVNLQQVDMKVMGDVATAESKYLENSLDLLVSKVNCIDTTNIVLTPKEVIADEENQVDEQSEEEVEEVGEVEKVEEAHKGEAVQENASTAEEEGASDETQIAEAQVDATPIAVHSWVSGWRTNRQGLIWLGNAYVEEH